MLPKSLKVSVSLPVIDQHIAVIQKNQEILESRCKALLQELKVRSDLWQKFTDNVQNVKQSVEEVDFMMDLMSVHSNVDYRRLASATENLQVRTLRNFYRMLRLTMIQKFDLSRRVFLLFISRVDFKVFP